MSAIKMRIIKFRAWDTQTKIMHYELAEGEFFDGIHPTFVLHYRFPPHDQRFALMQYTDLKDKNGKGIYEGDIIRIIVGTQPRTIGAVTYSGWQYLVTMEVAGNEKTSWFGFNSEDGDPARIEVIGNIYENPELLKEQGAESYPGSSGQ
jgi:uncharacterized phage protein (TIGR01671 family)